VAPDERRQKVFEEINRPTFSRLSPSLEQVCRYIGFSTLRDELQRVGDLMEHLKLSFLDRISEPCTPEEA
jgi:predicted phosphoadenosine phosphosulfate sulfurtransferase